MPREPASNWSRLSLCSKSLPMRHGLLTNAGRKASIDRTAHWRGGYRTRLNLWHVPPVEHLRRLAASPYLKLIGQRLNSAGSSDLSIRGLSLFVARHQLPHGRRRIEPHTLHPARQAQKLQHSNTPPVKVNLIPLQAMTC